MFEYLAGHRRILVTGPQRSGTTIAGRMIASDTGHRYIDEAEFGVYDVDAWRELLTLDDVVIQCPHMFKPALDEARIDVLVVLMRRDLEAIHASESRISWEDTYRGNSAELAVFGLSAGSSAAIKYQYWESRPKPPSYLELPYEVLADHPLFVPAGKRASFGRKDTAEAVDDDAGTISSGQSEGGIESGSEALTASWRQWLAHCHVLGIATEHILEATNSAGITPDAVTKERERMRGHPYLLAAQRTGYRVRKLEALLETSRTLSLASRMPLAVDQRFGLSESDFVEQYYCRNRPLVIKELTSEWSARDWTPRSLAVRCGDRLTLKAAHPGLDGRHLARSTLMSSFLEVLTGTEVAQDEYLAPNSRLLADTASADLLADLQPRPAVLGPDDSGASTRFWLGPSGFRTDLHYDVHNLLVVPVFGRQLVVLAAPDQTPLLYNTSGAVSEVDPEAPDLLRHPAFSTCRLYEVLLEPGSALFIPVGWWHQLRCLESAIALSFTQFTVANDFASLARVAQEAGEVYGESGKDDAPA